MATPNIKLYKNHSNPNVVGKSLTDMINTNFHFMEPTDTIHPVIKMEKNAEILKRNYCYINTTDRYYFIDSIRLCPGGMMELNLSMDPLESFKKGIAASTGLVMRCESAAGYNKYLNDPLLPILTKRKTTVKKSLGHFDTTLSNYIVVNGGAGVNSKEGSEI